jgi:hypothetical protein
MLKIDMYDNCVWGKKVSEYGLKHNRLDYRCLAQIVGDMILNNNIFTSCYDDWYLENGIDYDEETDTYTEVFQYYIVSDKGAEILKNYTDEILYYNENLDMYLWGIDHWGTGWDYVLTNIELEKVSYN